MQLHNGKLPRARQLARWGQELSREARLRLHWMDFYRTHQHNAALTCRHFGISRQTFYRWKRRYHPQDLSRLEPRSHRPHRRRQPTWTPQLAEQVLRLRQQYPRWGKDKLVVLLHRQGRPVSISMVGRILTHLRKRALLQEAPRNGVTAARQPPRPRPYAVRKPRDWRIEQPGDLVEVDTLELRPVPGVIVKHYTARDVVSRWDVLEAHGRATSLTATSFLTALQQRMPFPIRALQVDGGSEFAAEFEQACQQRGLHLFVLPPRSPKLNGAVERAQRTHTEEFYEVTPCALDLSTLNRELQHWERIYNTVRPHQALDYLTPEQFVVRWKSRQKEEKCH